MAIAIQIIGEFCTSNMIFYSMPHTKRPVSLTGIALTTRQIANGYFKLNLANQILVKVANTLIIKHNVAINFGIVLIFIVESKIPPKYAKDTTYINLKSLCIKYLANLIKDR